MKEFIRLNSLRITYTFTRILGVRSPQLTGSLLSFMWFRPLQRRASASRHELAQASETQKLHVRGRSILLRTWGATEKSNPEIKRRIVFVHGWGGRWDQFSDMICFFVDQGYCVSAFDFPAHGEADGFSTDLWEWFEVLKSIEKKVGTDAIWICHSFGFIAVAQAFLRGSIHLQKVVALNSPHKFSFLVDQFVQKLKVNSELKPYLIQAIERRVGPHPENVASVPIENLAKKAKLLFIADEDDREVPFTQHFGLDAIVGADNFIITKNLGHNGVLRDLQVFGKIWDFLKFNGGPVF